MSHLEIWHEPDIDLWHWRYMASSPDGGELELQSNREFTSRAAALQAATTAYPDVAVRDGGHHGSGRRRGRRRRLTLLLLVVLLLVAWRRVGGRMRGRRHPAT